MLSHIFIYIPILFIFIYQIITKEIVFPVKSNGFNIWMRRISPTSVYISNFGTNILYDIEQGEIGSFYFIINYAEGSMYPKLFFTSNGDLRSVFFNWDNSIILLDIQKWLTYDLGTLLNYQFNTLTFTQIEEENYIAAICFPHNNTKYISLFTTSNLTFWHDFYIKTSNSCSSSLTVGISESGVMFIMFADKGYDGLRYFYLLKALNNNKYTLSSGTTIRGFINELIGRMQYIFYYENIGLFCAFYPSYYANSRDYNYYSPVYCQGITVKNGDPSAGEAVEVIRYCIKKYENYFIMHKLSNITAIVGCQNYPSFLINIVSYNSFTKQYTMLQQKSPLEIVDQYFSDFVVLSDYKIFQVSIREGFRYYYQLIGFSFGTYGTPNEELDLYYAYYQDGDYYYPCWETCYQCLDKGNEIKNNCESCRIGTYPFEDMKSNCAKKGDEGEGYIFNPLIEMFTPCFYYFYIIDNRFICDSCNDVYKYLIEEDKRCVEHCPDFNLLNYDTQCVDVCPIDSFMLNSQDCIIFKDANNTPVILTDEVEADIEVNVVRLASSGITFIQGLTFNLLYYNNKDNITVNTSNEYSSISHIDFSHCEEILRTTFGITDDLLISVFETFNESSIVPSTKYKIYDSQGTPIDLKQCDSYGGIRVTKHILNEEIMNMTFAKRMASQNIDVFNRNHPFFNDICYPYANEVADVTLKNRVKDYYLNYSLCDSNCVYAYVDFDANKVVCDCYEEKEEEKHNYFIETFLYSTNLPLFTCYKQAFDYKKYKDSVGFYFYSSVFVFELLVVLIFFCTSSFTRISVKLYRKYSEIDTSIRTNENVFTTLTPKPLLKPSPNPSLIIHNKDNLDGAVYSKVQKEDNRNLCRFFLDILISKIDLISLFIGLGEYDIFLVSLSIFFFSLSTDFFMNAILFADEAISECYHNEGSLSFLSTFILSYSSNILSFIVVYIVTKLTYFSTPLELMANEIIGHKYFYTKYNRVMFVIKTKLYIYFIVLLIFIPGYYYFLCAFCAVYHTSQWNWFWDSFISFGLSMLNSFITTLVITGIRYFGLWLNSEKVYNISLYLNR